MESVYFLRGKSWFPRFVLGGLGGPIFQSTLALTRLLAIKLKISLTLETANSKQQTAEDDEEWWTSVTNHPRRRPTKDVSSICPNRRSRRRRRMFAASHSFQCQTPPRFRRCFPLRLRRYLLYSATACPIIRLSLFLSPFLFYIWIVLASSFCNKIFVLFYCSFL